MALAESQHGVIHLAQAESVGLSRAAVYRLVRRGEWRRLLREVFATSRSADPRLQWLSAASLWAGGAPVSHRSAGELYELDGVATGFIEITVSGLGVRSNDKVMVHRAHTRPAVHRVRGVPVTSVARTLLDLASVLDEDRLEFAIEDALRRRLTSLPVLARAVAAAPRQRGTASLRKLLAYRRIDDRPTDTIFEAMLLQVLDRNRFPRPSVQHVVELGSRRARLDFAYPAARIGIEADSYRWHSGRTAWTKDRARLTALVAAGWRVVQVTYDELSRGGPEFIPALRGLLGQQRLLGE